MQPSKSHRKSFTSQFNLFLKSNGYSERTIETYMFHIEKLARENSRLARFSYKDVVLLISNPSFSLRYRQVIVAALKQYYHFMVWWGKRDAHPCPNFRIRSNYSQNFLKEDFLTASELRLIRSREQRYKHLDLRDKVLLSIMTVQGLSPAEIALLDLQHINLHRQKMYVAPGRKHKKRTLALMDDQIELISAYLFSSRAEMLKQKSNAFLIGMTGDRITVDSIHYLISTLRGLVPEKKITPSMIRQSVIVWWLNDLKIPLEQVQLMCGHRWISSTQKYQFHLTENDVQLVNLWQ